MSQSTQMKWLKRPKPASVIKDSQAAVIHMSVMADFIVMLSD